jgi:HlyD family secretion protein
VASSQHALAGSFVRGARRGALPVALLFLLACHRSAPAPAGYQGLVEYDDHVVSFEASGRVERVEVRRGDVVTAEQTVATLDDAVERLTVDSHRQDESAAQADFALLAAGSRREDIASRADDVRGAMTDEDLMRTSAERERTLYAEGAIAKAELDKAEADLAHAKSDRESLQERLAALRHGARPEELARARARLDQSKAQLSLEEELLARHALRAGTAGEVVDVATKPGELAAVGTPAVTIADTSHPYVDVFVPQGELDGFRPGAHAEVRVDATNAPFQAAVEFVSPQTEFTPKFLFSDRERPHLVVRVRVRVADPDGRLHSGVPAFARIGP